METEQPEVGFRSGDGPTVAVGFTKKPFTFFLAACLAYWAICAISEVVAARLEARAEKDDAGPEHALHDEAESRPGARRRRPHVGQQEAQQDRHEDLAHHGREEPTHQSRYGRYQEILGYPALGRAVRGGVRFHSGPSGP